LILKQYYLGCLAHASYLVADEASGVAAVVDPQRDVDGYVEDAHRLGCHIDHVFLTHFHADFVAGHLELRDREGARIYLGSRAAAEYEFTPLGDRDSVRLGQVRLEVLETPGHSPESISILVYDLSEDERRPHAVLSGDTLFIGDVGRPDLRASLGWSAEALGRMLYDSLHAKLLRLPDETLLYPAHGAGSLCGRNLSTDTVSTIGVQRRYNYALQPMDRDEFVRAVTADQPDTPAYFTYDAVLNTRERPTLDRALDGDPRPLTLAQALAPGVQLLDTRDPAEFAGAHLAGSLNVGLGGAMRPGPARCSSAARRSRSSPSRAGSGRRRFGSGASGSTTWPAISTAACRPSTRAPTWWRASSESRRRPSPSSSPGRRRRWCSTSGPGASGRKGESTAA
jgi:hydroxyacylglutathione hydrolase